MPVGHWAPHMTIFGATGYLPFFAGAAVLAMSCVPLVVIRGGGRSLDRPEKLVSIVEAFMSHPAAMLGALADGVPRAGAEAAFRTSCGQC